MTQRIPLVNGRGFALVDDADVPLISAYRWCRLNTHNTSYAVTWTGSKPNRRCVYMHILLMGQPGIDHRDRDGLNNQRSNLRPATQSQNNANQRSRGGVSAYRGVVWCKQTGRWRAQMRLNGQQRHLGRFDREEDAARAYDVAALAAWGEFATPNFPAELTR
jgi:hypothetical protein